MDIYQPTGDALARRPVIIFAHQGGFVTGLRTDAYMVDVCTQFARLGYVTASIDYRLLDFGTILGGGFDTVNIAKSAIRGMQDLRAAVRFFRKDAATTNTYRVNPSYIVVGGSSAGGFAALEVGYLDKASEVPAYVGLAALGGIEGASGNPGYSSLPLAVLNLSGATEQPQPHRGRQCAAAERARHRRRHRALPAGPGGRRPAAQVRVRQRPAPPPRHGRGHPQYAAHLSGRGPHSLRNQRGLCRHYVSHHSRLSAARAGAARPGRNGRSGAGCPAGRRSSLPQPRHRRRSRGAARCLGQRRLKPACWMPPAA